MSKKWEQGERHMDASDIKVRIIADNDNIIDGLKATADALDEVKKKSEEMNA